MKFKLGSITKEQWSWALYDWGNSAFATTVMAGFFPVFFKEFWSAGVDPSLSTFRLGLANSAASLIIALIAPLLGAVADRGSARKKLLIFFAFLGVAMTGALPLVAKGQWEFAAILYGVATLGFMGGNIFYDSLLVSIAKKERYDFISALGFSLGYLGGGILFAVNILMVTKPALFGLADAGEGVRLSFITVALWWALFTIPIALFVKEPEGEGLGAAKALRAGVSDLIKTARRIKALKPVFTFLIAYWLYIDGVDTIIRMAVDYGMSLGFEASSLMTALLLTQFIGFPAAIVFGKVGEKIGTKKPSTAESPSTALSSSGGTT